MTFENILLIAERSESFVPHYRKSILPSARKINLLEISSFLG